MCTQLRGCAPACNSHLQCGEGALLLPGTAAGCWLSVLCISLQTTTVTTTPSICTKPTPTHPFQTSIPGMAPLQADIPAAQASYPALALAVQQAQGSPMAEPGAVNSTAFATTGGAQWAAFAKANNGSWQQEHIFEDMVVPGVQASFGLADMAHRIWPVWARSLPV